MEYYLISTLFYVVDKGKSRYIQTVILSSTPMDLFELAGILKEHRKKQCNVISEFEMARDWCNMMNI